jgi:hypothetical protein
MSKSTSRQANRNNNQVLETSIQVPNKKEDALVEQLNFEIECPKMCRRDRVVLGIRSSIILLWLLQIGIRCSLI